jgi:hypothetical protein
VHWGPFLPATNKAIIEPSQPLQVWPNTVRDWLYLTMEMKEWVGTMDFSVFIERATSTATKPSL